MEEGYDLEVLAQSVRRLRPSKINSKIRDG